MQYGFQADDIPKTLKREESGDQPGHGASILVEVRPLDVVLLFHSIGYSGTSPRAMTGASEAQRAQSK